MPLIGKSEFLEECSHDRKTRFWEHFFLFARFTCVFYVDFHHTDAVFRHLFDFAENFTPLNRIHNAQVIWVIGAGFLFK